MKNILACILLFHCSVTFSQLASSMSRDTLPSNDYGGYSSSLFLYHQGIARSEAMGKTAVAEGNSVIYGIYNPALVGELKNFEFQAGAMSPNSGYDNGFYANFSVAGRYHKRFATSFNYQKIRSEEFNFTDEVGNIISTERSTDTRASLVTAFTMLEKNHHKLSSGISLNLLSNSPYSALEYTGGTMDLGVSYRAEIDSIHQFTCGASINNLTNQKIWLNETVANNDRFYILPQVLRTGFSYTFKPDYKVLTSGRSLIQSTVHGEYDELINSDYFSTWKVGLELKWLEMISLRGGYYSGNAAILDGNYAYTGSSIKDYKAFTYGGGIELNFSDKSPDKDQIFLGIDYARLPFYDALNQSEISKFDYNTHFSVVNMRLTWELR